MPSRSKAALTRQNPTRMPYSCQLQLGMSGTNRVSPGGVSTARGIGLAVSQFSMLNTGQTTIRTPSGSVSGSRSTMAL